MEVKLLTDGYRNHESFYQDFLDGNIEDKEEYFSGETAFINLAPDFPIYMALGTDEEKKCNFLKAFHIITRSYLDTDRDLLLDQTFWHSLLVTHKRDYIIENYPKVTESRSEFHKIVLKKFDWENYIYKCIIAAQYVTDNVSSEKEQNRYYELIIGNLDIYNYIIKYEIFRNDRFLLNILDIIDELGISSLMKAEIKGREDLGDDERYGRRVIFEFNKSYPIVMAPVLDKETLKKPFIAFLNKYYDITKVLSDEVLEYYGYKTEFTPISSFKREVAASNHDHNLTYQVSEDKY